MGTDACVLIEARHQCTCDADCHSHDNQSESDSDSDADVDVLACMRSATCEWRLDPNHFDQRRYGLLQRLRNVYAERDYRLFAAICGERARTGDVALFPCRGWPRRRCSPQFRWLWAMAEYNVTGHTWITLRELELCMQSVGLLDHDSRTGAANMIQQCNYDWSTLFRGDTEVPWVLLYEYMCHLSVHGISEPFRSVSNASPSTSDRRFGCQFCGLARRDYSLLTYRCRVCRSATYCSRECMEAHGQTHASECGIIAPVYTPPSRAIADCVPKSRLISALAKVKQMMDAIAVALPSLRDHTRFGHGTPAGRVPSSSVPTTSSVSRDDAKTSHGSKDKADASQWASHATQDATSTIENGSYCRCPSCRSSLAQLDRRMSHMCQVLTLGGLHADVLGICCSYAQDDARQWQVRILIRFD